MHTWGKRIGSVALVGAATLALTTFNSGPLSALENASAHGGSITMDTSTRKDWLVGAMPVCLHGTGEDVVLTGVRPHHGDVEVVAYTVRPNPYPSRQDMIGNSTKPFSAHGLAPYDGTPLALSCGKQNRQFYELIVQLRSGSVSTSTDGFDVTYTIDGAHRELTVPLKVILCAKPRDPGCAYPLPTQPPPVTYTV